MGLPGKPALPVSQSTAGTAGTRGSLATSLNAQGDMETEGQCRHIAGLEEDCSSNMEITFGISMEDGRAVFPKCEKFSMGSSLPNREATFL